MGSYGRNKARTMVSVAGASLLVLGFASGPAAAEPAPTGFFLDTVGSVEVVTESENSQESNLPTSFSPVRQSSSATSTGGVESTGGTIEVVRDTESGALALADTSLADEGPDTEERKLIASAPGRVELSWDGIARAKSFDIYRDDALIGTTSDKTYTDIHNVPHAGIHSYRIEGLDEAGSPVDIWGGPGLALPSDANLGDASLLEDEIAQIQLAYHGLAISYMTFIPDKFVDSPRLGCEYGSDYMYDGNDRGWSTTGGHLAADASKTHMNAYVYFGANSANFGSETFVPPSSVYRKSDGMFIEQREVTGGQIEVRNLGGPDDGANESGVQFLLSKTNPFCHGGAIDAGFTMTITSSGTYRIDSGTHRQMPNHEIYIHNNEGQAVTTVYRAAMLSPGCLASSASCPLLHMGGRQGNWG